MMPLAGRFENSFWMILSFDYFILLTVHAL
jgi:hypothetical protein